MKILSKSYHLYIKILDNVAPVFLLVVRGYIGYRFFKTGMGKLENLPSVTEFFMSLGIPSPALNACMAGATELVGGVLLLLGLGSRIVALPLTVTMIVAYMTAHLESVIGFFDDPTLFFSQEPFPFLITALMVLFFGPGKWSLDQVLHRRWSNKEG